MSPECCPEADLHITDSTSGFISPDAHQFRHRDLSVLEYRLQYPRFLDKRPTIFFFEVTNIASFKFIIVCIQTFRLQEMHITKPL